METTTRQETSRWSGVDLLAALQVTSAYFEGFVPSINALNVFPVPDGDTGTNMSQTLQAAYRATNQLDVQAGPSAGEVLSAAAHGALMGARGNSGVILYQIISGLAETARGAEEMDGPLLAAGLQRASELAYQAVAKPVEGTMLTVVREAARAAAALGPDHAAIEEIVDAALRGAEEALARTPEQLPILKQAGVVDAGGRGVVVLLDGLQQFVRGASPESLPAPPPTGVAAAMDFLDLPDIVHDAGELGYCTNFVVTGDALPLGAFRQRMAELGRSMVVVGDASAIKVHIHSEHPGTILEAALAFGELRNVRIDNMSAQTQALLSERQHLAPSTPATDTVASGLAVVAVASGEGLRQALLGMGAAAVVPGGPTVNPSTEEILRVVREIPAAEIILLPNDPNVIPTARQVEKLTDKAVRVVPSRSVPEGISALSALNLEAELDENVAAMTEALPLVHALALTRATRSAEIGAVAVREGQFIGLIDGELRVAGDEAEGVVLDVLGQVDVAAAELLTIFTGQPADRDLVSSVQEAIAAKYPDLTLEVTAGGQPHYQLIMALE